MVVEGDADAPRGLPGGDRAAGSTPVDLAYEVSADKGDQTLAALHLQYLDAWVDWSHEQGFIARRTEEGGAPTDF